jgi:hypothetical protein
MAEDPKETKVAVDPAIKREADALGLEKLRAEVQKLRADAESATAKSQGDVLKAMLGEAPSSGFAGGVSVSEGAALAEQTSLARRKAKELAKATATDLLKVATGSHIYLTNGDTLPSRSLAQTFDLQFGAVARALNDAIKLSDAIMPTAAKPPKGVVAAVPVIAAAGLVLSGINSVLSYFRSDYQIGGRALSGDLRAFVSSFAHELIAHGRKVWLDGAVPPVDASVIKALTEELSALGTKASEARSRAAEHARMAKVLTPIAVLPAPSAAGAAPKAAPNPDPKGLRPGHERAEATLSSAISAYEAFLTALFANESSTPPIQLVAQARALDAFLADEGATIAAIKLGEAFGTKLSTKNLLTTLKGEVPFKVSAFISASW